MINILYCLQQRMLDGIQTSLLVIMQLLHAAHVARVLPVLVHVQYAQVGDGVTQLHCTAHNQRLGLGWRLEWRLGLR